MLRVVRIILFISAHFSACEEPSKGADLQNELDDRTNLLQSASRRLLHVSEASAEAALRHRQSPSSKKRTMAALLEVAVKRKGHFRFEKPRTEPTRLDTAADLVSQHSADDLYMKHPAIQTRRDDMLRDVTPPPLPEPSNRRPLTSRELRPFGNGSTTSPLGNGTKTVTTTASTTSTMNTTATLASNASNGSLNGSTRDVDIFSMANGSTTENDQGDGHGSEDELPWWKKLWRTVSRWPGQLWRWLFHRNKEGNETTSVPSRGDGSPGALDWFDEDYVIDSPYLPSPPHPGLPENYTGEYPPINTVGLPDYPPIFSAK